MANTKTLFARFLPVLAFFALLTFIPSTVLAGIVFTNDVSPAEPTSWNSSTVGYVGNTAAGTATVNSGSVLSSQNGWLGYTATGTGVATVDGVGSTWTNSWVLSVGEAGSGTLNISNGGYVSSNGGGVIGDGTGSVGAATVDGIGSNWNSYSGLIIGNGGNGTLSITNGGYVSNFGSNIGSGSGSTGVASVDGTSSTWNSGPLYIGNSGYGTLTITNGGYVYSSNSNSGGVIGYNAGSVGAATVDGAGSRWIDNGPLDVGFNGQASLNITNGGYVSGGGGGYIGYNSGSTGVVTVDGRESTFHSGGTLSVGYSGNGTLIITNGGIVNGSSNCYIAYGSGSTGVATVDGSGSTWNRGGPISLYVGYSGNGALNITNGGQVGGTGFIGDNSGSTGVVTVDGSGSTWTGGSLYVGYSGNGTMNITGVAVVTDSQGGGGALGGVIGCNAGSTGAVTVSGTGSTWNNNALFVGFSGTGTLNVVRGATVTSQFGSIAPQGSFGTTTAGTATVDGSGSTWTDTGVLWVVGGMLRITNGGAVTVNGNGLPNGQGTTIASSSPSTGILTVDGTGSTFTNKSSLYVGDGDNGTLNITNGGTVISNGLTYLGGGAGIGAAAATVDGSGSTWNAPYGLAVGGGGVCTLSITNGGAVHGGADSIGTGTATVDGSGSTWTNGNGLTVNGMLKITNSGSVASIGTVSIGYAGTGTVTVDGSGSTWSNSGGLSVGLAGTGTLNISNGGAVVTNYIVSTSVGTINFDGGILKAYNAGNSAWMTTGSGTANVYVEEEVAQFDTSGYNMGIPITLQHGGSVFDHFDGGVTKLGAGTLTLSAINTYTGDTTVSAGLLVLASTGSILLDINNSTEEYSQLLGTGSLDLEGTLKLNLTTGVTDTSDLWQLVADTLGSTTYGAAFAVQTTTGGTFTGSGGILSYVKGSQLWTFTESTGVLTLSVVPEPCTLVLLITGLLGVLAYIWRKRK